MVALESILTFEEEITWNRQRLEINNDFNSISAGGFHSLALKSDGNAVGWGWDDYNQATPPAGDFNAISAGWFHSFGLKKDGTIVCWGSDSWYQSTPPEKRPEIIALIETFKANVVDIGQKTVMVEISGPEEKIEAFIEMCRPYGIKNVARTGTIAMPRQEKTASAAQENAEE
jgi:alpha-tubulin suppressor-like RCC1 family protein